MFDGIQMMDAKRVTVGVITGPHGVRGAVKVKSFTAEPAALFTYAPLLDARTGRTLALRRLGEAKGVWIAAIEGVNDRNGAEALKGVELAVERDRLPPLEAAGDEQEEEFYHADLLGLAVRDLSGASIGTLAAVHDFGAGDMVEVRRESGGRVLIPFTRAAVPVIDIAGGFVVVDPPAEVLADARAEAEPQEDGA